MSTGTARDRATVRAFLLLAAAVFIVTACFAERADASWVREKAPVDPANVSATVDGASLRLLPDGTAVYLRTDGGTSKPTRLARRQIGGTHVLAPPFPETFAKTKSTDSLGLSLPDAAGNLLVYRNGDVSGMSQGSFLLAPGASPASASPSSNEFISAISMSQSGAAAAIVGGGSTKSVSFRPAGAGSAFDAPRMLDRAGNQRSYAVGITLDPDGGVFVVYETEQESGLFQAYAPPGGDFGAPKLLPVPSESIDAFGMEEHYAQSTNGHAIFTWSEFQKTGMNWEVRAYAAIRKPGGMLGAPMLVSGVEEGSGHSVSAESQGITDDGTAYVGVLEAHLASRCPVTNLDGDGGMVLAILPPGASTWNRLEGNKTWPSRTEFGPIVTAGNMVAVGRLDSTDSGERCASGTGSTSSIAVHRGQGASLGGPEELARQDTVDRNVVRLAGLAVNAVGQVSAPTREPAGTGLETYFNTREIRYAEDTKAPDSPAPILTRPGKIKLSGKVLKATRNRVALPTTCVSVGPGDKVACVVNANITSAHEAVSRAKGAISTATASAKAKAKAKAKSGKKKATKKGKARGKKGEAKKRQVSLGRVKTRIAPGKTKRVIIKLNRRAKQALKKRKVIPITLKVTITKKGAEKLVITRKMRLRAQAPKKARGKAKKRGRAAKKGRAKARSVTMATRSAAAVATSSAAPAAAVATSSAAKSKPKISLVKARPVKVVPTEINRFAYTDRVELSCRGKSTPLMTGWSSPQGSVGSTYISTYSDRTTFGLMMIAPARTGTFKGSVTCLNRAFKTKFQTGKQADEKVSRTSCSKRQVAIGMPVRNAPYYDKNVYSRPVGVNGWETNEGKYAAAQVLCLPKASMRALKLVKRSAGFKAGARTAKVSATCKGGRVPISWGFESDAMPENTWRGGSNPAMAPLISQSARQGKKGWSLTFFTPDGNPAVKAGRVAIHLTCAKPR